MTNIDDTRTVYDEIKISWDARLSGKQISVCVGDFRFKTFKKIKQAEKFRADLIRFVENYK